MIDFHQHIGHAGRTVEHVLDHQDAHGVRQSVLLPIDGTSTRLERFPSAEALDEARQHPDRLIPFFHVDPLRPRFRELIRRGHEFGAKGFGEHKVRLPVDAPESLAIYNLCAELGLPVLLQFEYGVYNFNYEAFGDVVRRFPEVTFIGHAQAFWANVSAGAPHDFQAAGFTAYPRGKIVPGGLTDRWLEQFPNLYGDLSAGSGLNALTRDPDFTPGFLERQGAKLLWATDCPCRDGAGDCGDDQRRECFAARSLPLLREVASPATFDLITTSNARRLLGL